MKGPAAEQLVRRSIRLKGYDYSQAGGYSITIVTYGREYLFGEVVGGDETTKHRALMRPIQPMTA